MTHSCRICAKLACPKRGEVEGCKECISYVWLAMQEIDKKFKWEEDKEYDRFLKNRAD